MRKAYDWDQWFGRPADEDGKVRFVLVKGEHYRCSQSSMCQQVRTAAKDRGLLVNVQDLDDRIAVAARKAPPIPMVGPSYLAPTMKQEDEESRSRERNA